MQGRSTAQTAFKLIRSRDQFVLPMHRVKPCWKKCMKCAQWFDKRRKRKGAADGGAMGRAFGIDGLQQSPLSDVHSSNRSNTSSAAQGKYPLYRNHRCHASGNFHHFETLKRYWHDAQRYVHRTKVRVAVPAPSSGTTSLGPPQPCLHHYVGCRTYPRAGMQRHLFN